jgi:L-rhamnose-H+ transport protein
MGVFEGLVLTFLAGSMAGANLLPLKWIRTWKWENFWFVYSIVSLTIVPFSLAFFLLPHLATVYASTPLSALFKPLLYGFLWGIAQLGAGICVDKIGLALTSSILNGLCATFGSLTPLVVQHSEMLSQRGGRLLLLGIVVMLIGVVLCGWAGLKRERAHARPETSAQAGTTYFLLMILVVVSGLLAAMLNIALAFGGGVVELAQAQGAAATWAVFAVWPIALTGGLIVNLTYSAVLLSRNNTWSNFLKRPAEAGNPIIGGTLWMLAIATYSSGTVLLGILGVSVGWALFQITTLLAGNLAGIWAGEWQSVNKRIFNVNIAGVAVLLLATVVMAVANYSVH